MGNKVVMSLAIQPELRDSVKKYAKRKGLSTSSYIGDLLEQAVKINIDDDAMVVGKPIDEELTPVVLKVPTALRGDSEQLKKWLSIQMNGLAKALVKN
jgi:hypothetical protein